MCAPSAPNAGPLLFNSENESDLSFSVSSNLSDARWRFPAHSFILRTSSPVFQALVDSHKQIMQEMAARNEKPEIYVQCPPEIFFIILSYIYKNEVTISSVPNCLLLLKVAIKFELDNLIYLCLTFLYEKTDTDNLINILSCLYELINTGNLCFTGLQLNPNNNNNLNYQNGFNGRNSPLVTDCDKKQTNLNSNNLQPFAGCTNGCLSPYPERYSPIPGGGRISPYFNGDTNTLNVNNTLNHNQNSSDNIVPQQPANYNGNCNFILNKLFFKCYTILDANAELILKSECVNTIEHSLLVDILSRDTLKINSELTTFNLVTSWSNQQCLKTRQSLISENKRNLAGKALYLVRYLTMSQKEFLSGPYGSDLLINEEKTVLLNAIIKGGCILQNTYFDNETNCNLFSENGNINLDNLQLNGQYINQDLQWILNETKMHVKRKYFKPTCLVAPNRININANSHPLLDELNNENDSNNNDSSYSNNNGSTSGLTVKKKSKPKKLLNGIGDFIICFIQLLD